MSFIVRTNFPYKNKYFDSNDNTEQQVTDYIMHEYTLRGSNFEINGRWSLATATTIADALNASSLFNATATVTEEIDDTETPAITYRKITITT